MEYGLLKAPPPPPSNSPILQFSNSPILQFSNSPILQFSSSPVLQFSSSPVLQFSSSPILQFSSSPVLQFSNSPILQFSRLPSPVSRLLPTLKKLFEMGQTARLYYCIRSRLDFALPMPWDPTRGTLIKYLSNGFRCTSSLPKSSSQYST